MLKAIDELHFSELTCKTSIIATRHQKLVIENVEGKESMVAPPTFRYDEDVSLRLFYLSIIMHKYPFNIVEHYYLV